MATMRRDARLPAVCIGLGLMAAGPDARAQLTVPQAAAPATATPSLGAVLTPTLSAQIVQTDNATLTSDDKKQGDTIVSVSPGLALQYRSANTAITGQFRLSSVSYVQNTQSSQVLPNGRVVLRSDVARQGLGLDAALSADQVKSQFTSVTSASPSTTDTYTNTRLYVSPFIERSLDAQTRLNARLERTQTHATANDNGLNNRPDTNSSGASLSLTRRPTRLGYALETRYQDARTSGPLPSLNTQRSVRGKALYALSPELELGLVLGHESNQILQQRTQGNTKGVQLDWRPNERTQFKVLAEDRFFGRSWNGDLAYRSPKWSLGLSSSRQIDNYAGGTTATSALSGGSTQALLDALLTTRIPNEAERAKAVSDLMAQRNLPQQLGSSRDLYDLNTLVRQNVALRTAIMGSRSMVLLAAGQTHAHPLSGNAFSSLLGAGNDTRERFMDVQLNHRLTPIATVTMGLRLGRARVNNLQLNTATTSREQGLRISLSTALSPRTQAVCGLRRQRTIGTTTGGLSNATVTENTAFAGLEHRF